jgi:Uma2 family endonuclease
MARELIEPAVAERRLRMTYEEWLAWAGGHEGKSEWVDGEVIVFSPTSQLHGQIVFFLATLLMQYVQFRRLGEVLGGSFEMRLERAGRVPDLLFVAREHLDRLTSTRLHGPADLVVEVVSEDSVARDRVEKLAEYAAAGVPEYWLVDARPDRRCAEFFRLIDGAYRSVMADADGRYQSPVVAGFWLRPAWLEQDPLPDALDCLFEIEPEVLRAALLAASPAGDRPDGAPDSTD